MTAHLGVGKNVTPRPYLGLMGVMYLFPAHPDARALRDTPRDGSAPPAPDSHTHDAFDVSGLHAELCAVDGSVAWSDNGCELDGMEAVARLFGSFELVGRLDAITAPGPAVFVYLPGSMRGRARLRSVPTHEWMEVAPELWAMSDGAALLLSPTDPLLAFNLAR